MEHLTDKIINKNVVDLPCAFAVKTQVEDRAQIHSKSIKKRRQRGSAGSTLHSRFVRRPYLECEVVMRSARLLTILRNGKHHSIRFTLKRHVKDPKRGKYQIMSIDPPQNIETI